MPRLYVGTNGLSVWSSTDLGDTLERMGSGTGLYSGSRVWALAPGPAAGTLLAGTDTGVYLLDCSAGRWQAMHSPMDATQVTALAWAADRSILLAGTQPAGLFRSTDAGHTWNTVVVAMKPYASVGFHGAPAGEGVQVKHWTRVTQILFDPADSALAWTGVEIDGAWRSVDGGLHWERTTTGFITEDIHGFATVHGAAPTLLATTDRGTHVSHDEGLTWEFRRIDSPWQYTRSIVERTDHTGVLFMTNGSGPPGTDGRLFRSRDYGNRWERVELPGSLDSSLYFLAVHESDPQLIFAATALGQIFRSTDGGESWSALRRRLGEIRTLAWVPA